MKIWIQKYAKEQENKESTEYTEPSSIWIAQVDISRFNFSFVVCLIHDQLSIDIYTPTTQFNSPFYTTSQKYHYFSMRLH